MKPTQLNRSLGAPRRFGALAIAALMVATLLTVLGGPVSAQNSAGAGATPDNPTLVVNNTGDGPDVSGADGVCATSTGVCTLRAAIAQANANLGSDRIEFAIPGSGVRRIDVGSPLPTINDATGGVTIDGYTQPGASANTLAQGSNAVLRIEVRGQSTNTLLLIESAENTLRGLAVYGASYPVELRGEGADGNLIIGNFIGTDATATSLWTSYAGVTVNLGPDRNRIGTPALADRNVISGNGAQGIRVNHGETSENRIQNNIIGLSPDGTRDMGGGIGIDIQWWSWGNLIGGTGPNEANVVSATNNGIDLSHKATGNLVLGNLVGTTFDGQSANDITRNSRAIIIKDDAQGNYFADNTVAGAEGDYAIWHKHNYTGGNTFVDNRIGVGVTGSNIGGGARGMLLRGHDDLYDGNTFANNGGIETILISNTSIRDGATYEPDEQTVRNTVRRGTYYNNADPKPIEFGSTCCPHPNEDTPDIDGLGPGQVNGTSTCAGCEVEVYVSGSVAADGSLTPGTGTTGLTWIGTVYADNNGAYSMASPLLTVGSRVAVAGITPSGESSNFSAKSTVPSQGSGLVANPDQPVTIPRPEAPSEPPLYQPVTFDCTWDNGTVTWDDAGAPDYYVFASTGGTETYLGGHPTLSLTVPGADSYRVEHWVRGIATNAICDGPGADPEPDPFVCSATTGVLTWGDAGASNYYVFASTDGIETYLGGHPTLTLTVPGADSYRVEHWAAGQATNAICDGPGPDPEPEPFACSAADGVLTWDDAGASNYYVFATITAGGGETYLGGHPTLSLTVPGADSYRVEHWAAGQATNAICDGPGPDPEPEPFACSVLDGVLSWDDAQAATYYVFARDAAGVETYLGGHATLSLPVEPADSYRVEHWVTGQATNAICGSA